MIFLLSGSIAAKFRRSLTRAYLQNEIDHDQFQEERKATAGTDTPLETTT
jgi:hypothetical protein